MKTWGSGGIAPSFISLVLDGGDWSASCPIHFIPWGKNLQYPLDRRLGRSQSWCVDTVEKRKTSCPVGN
jgi:hypothetical protein